MAVAVEAGRVLGAVTLGQEARQGGGNGLLDGLCQVLLRCDDDSLHRTTLKLLEALCRHHPSYTHAALEWVAAQPEEVERI